MCATVTHYVTKYWSTYTSHQCIFEICFKIVTDFIYNLNWRKSPLHTLHKGPIRHNIWCIPWILCQSKYMTPPKIFFGMKWMEHIPMTPNNMNLATRALQKVLKLKFFFMSADLYSWIIYFTKPLDWPWKATPERP